MIPLGRRDDTLFRSVTEMIESCNKEWEQIKRNNKSLFEHPGIQEIGSNEVFPPMHDIDTDDVHVRVVSAKDCPYLGTSGVATCFAVAAIAKTPLDETYISLAHINLIPPKEVLEGMMIEFRNNGFNKTDIEFYIVGGMLPFEGLWGDTDSSFEKQKTFIDLSKEYNIKALKFNIVAGETGALTVIMTGDKLLWTLRENVFDFKSDSFASSEYSTDSESVTSSEYSTDSESATSSEETSDSGSSEIETSSEEEPTKKRKFDKL